MLEIDNWRDDDTDQLAEWCEFDPEVPKVIGLPPNPTRGDVETFICQRMADEINGVSILRAVREDEQLIGYAYVNSITNGVGMAHTAVAPWHRGRGVDVAKAAIEAARQDDRIHTLIAIPWPLPEKAQQRYLKACGFTQIAAIGRMEV